MFYNSYNKFKFERVSLNKQLHKGRPFSAVIEEDKQVIA
jgi:hypothetical protein